MEGNADVHLLTLISPPPSFAQKHIPQAREEGEEGEVRTMQKKKKKNQAGGIWEIKLIFAFLKKKKKNDSIFNWL